MKKRQSQTKQTLRPKLRYNCSCWIQEEHRQPIFGVALNNAFGPRSDDPSNAVPQLCATAGANKCVEVPSLQINVLFCQFWSVQELLHKILNVSICLCVDDAFMFFMFSCLHSLRLSIYQCCHDGSLKLLTVYTDADSDEIFYTCAWTVETTTGKGL